MRWPPLVCLLAEALHPEPGWRLRLRLQIRRCTTYGCTLFGRPYRPEEEGGYALPHGEIGLDVIASVGAQRFGEHRSVPEIHQALEARQLTLCERSVTNLLQRYEELVSLHLLARPRVTERLPRPGACGARHRRAATRCGP